MKTRRFDFSYKPLLLTSSLDVEGSIPNAQEYDTLSQEWLPDYALLGQDGTPISPLVLQVRVRMVDPDGILHDGDITTQLVNQVWRWVETDNVGTISRTAITTSTSGFVIGTVGGTEVSDGEETVSTPVLQTGRLTVCRNVPVGKQVLVTYDADYVDSRTGGVIHIYLDKEIRLSTIAGEVPSVVLDRPAQTLWHPCRHGRDFSVRARLVNAGGEDVASNSCSFVWEVFRGNGTWSAIGSVESADFGWSVSADTATFSQDLHLMGEGLTMRCRATYEGQPTLGDNSPSAYFSIVRRVPGFEYDLAGVPEDIEGDTDCIRPQVVITDRQGVIDTNLEEFLIRWYRSEDNAVNPDWTLLGNGASLDILTDAMRDGGYMKIGVDVSVRGAAAPVAAGGSLLVDDENRIVFDR